MKKSIILSILFLSALFLSACTKKPLIDNNANTDTPSNAKQNDLTTDESEQEENSTAFPEEDLSDTTDQELLDKLEALEDESFDSDLDEINTELN